MKTPKNPHKALINSRYYYNNRERIKLKTKKYYQANKEKLKDRTRAWYRKARENPAFMEEKRSKAKKAYLKNREVALIKCKQHWKRMRLELLNFVGGCVCAKCGSSDYRALHIDHVNGGGVQELKLNKRTKYPRQYKMLIAENKSNYQVLCANCNFIKRYENNEHRKRKVVSTTEKKPLAAFL